MDNRETENQSSGDEHRTDSVYPDSPNPQHESKDFAFGEFFLGKSEDKDEIDHGLGYPEDLPPWYEDEYYDDRDWERLPRRTSTALRFGVFIAFVAILSLLTYNFVRGWVDNQLDPPGEPGMELVIEIPQGATTDDIARILAENDVVANGTVFRYYLRFKNVPDFQAGIYTFQTNSSVWDVRNSLEAGPMEIVEDRFYVTIPEGLTLEEMKISLLSQLPSFDSAELDLAIAQSKDPEGLGSEWQKYFKEGFFVPVKEGIFFPETYDVDESLMSNEQGLLNRMVSQFDLIAAETGLDNPPSELGLTPYQVLIIASLIEEEAALEEERGKIARVIYNRLEQNMPLGIDATIVYALGGDRELTLSDLTVDSPYNTRIVLGLPPTPISAPGRASIEAALNPIVGDWLFYVRTDDFGIGSHTFAVTEAEFNAAVQICVERDLGCG
jgi:UPF0755 protein|tara:strand:+ start:4649 stop:5968 length:1320 start_codon:yes stop_codon:yes gene_type:complete